MGVRGHKAGKWLRGAGGGIVALLLGGCRTASPEVWQPVGTDLRELAVDAVASSEPEQPERITFRWRVREADFRYQGRGVARVEPPYRLRIDLFTPQGETLFAAALVGGELRIPSWAPRELAPPPALLWAALGVFRPDPGLQLRAGRQGGDGTIIFRYGSEEGQELRFRMSRGGLTRVELHRDGHLQEEVDLRLEDATGAVVETVYRNLAQFVELTFTLESAEHVDSFPSTIWNPGR